MSGNRAYIKTKLKNLLKALDHTCYICGNHLSHNEVTKDHVFPKSQGYSIHYNMMPAHSSCNLDKGDRQPTTEEIILSCETYEKIGMAFDPRLFSPQENKIYTRPIEYLFHTCKEAA